MAEQQSQQVAVFIRQLLVSLVREIEKCNIGRNNLHSFFYIKMLFFWPRLNILIFLPIFG